MTRTLVAASILSLTLGVGSALAQATPPLNPPPTAPGASTTPKSTTSQGMHSRAHSKKMKSKRSTHSS